GLRVSPVGDQFKVLSLVTSPDQFLDYHLHEFITLGGQQVSRNQVTTAPYYPVTDGLCINGSIYYAAWAPKL
ncbi:hypothetical protein ISN45_Aa01g009330, partial [Arabidopsis thaliana x Arabidopsis arenosa]